MLKEIEDCLKQTAPADLALQLGAVGVFMHKLALLRQYSIHLRGQMVQILFAH